MFVTLFGILMLVSEVQPLNIASPIVVKLFPKSTLVRPVHPLNTEPDSVISPSIFKDVRLLHPLNAPPLSVVIVDGITSSFKPVLLNALSVI